MTVHHHYSSKRRSNHNNTYSNHNQHLQQPNFCTNLKVWIIRIIVMMSFVIYTVVQLFYSFKSSSVISAENHSNNDDPMLQFGRSQPSRQQYHQTTITTSDHHDTKPTLKQYQWNVCDPLYSPPNDATTAAYLMNESCWCHVDDTIGGKSTNNNTSESGSSAVAIMMLQQQQQEQRSHDNDVVVVMYMVINPLPTLTRYISCHHLTTTTTKHKNHTMNTISIAANSSITMELLSLASSSAKAAVATWCIHHHPAKLFLVPFPILDDGLGTTMMMSATTWTNQHSTSSSSSSSMIPPQFPIQVQSTSGAQFRPFEPCDVPCYYDVEPINDRFIHVFNGTTTWKIAYSMEGPQYWEGIHIQRTGWKEDRFWSTTSYQSEIPVPYYDNTTFHIWHTNFVPYETGLKRAVFIATNCDSKNNREQIVQEMMNHTNHGDLFPMVDSIGSCLHNANPPNGIVNDDKYTIMKQYLFYLAFENQCEDDYITEKLWGAYEAGTIPIYYGAPNVHDHIPHHSIIHVNDYTTTQELVDHLIAVSTNRTLYESYHAWRFQPIPEHFRIKYDFTNTHSTCRTCRWAYSRMYGIGWNHTTQSLRPLHVGTSSRRVCLSPLEMQRNKNSSSEIIATVNHHLVQHPFVEEWYNLDGQRLSTEPTIFSTTIDETAAAWEAFPNGECNHPLMDSNRIVNVNDGMLHRTVFNQDGVIDFIIRMGPSYNNSSNDNSLLLRQQPVSAVLRLHFSLLQQQQLPILKRNVRSGVWHVQTDKSRYTILLATSFSPVSNDTMVRPTTTLEHAIDIVISFPIRIRVIVEDVDDFHEGASEVENFFGKLMSTDFFNPVQVSIRIPIN